jgi:hypothetical protein
MPPSPRYTVRLPPALDALVQARVRTGTPFAMLIREALSAYLADSMPTPADRPPTPRALTPADSADMVSVLGEQLAILRARVEALEYVLTQRRHPADRCADRPADTRADSTPIGADRDADTPAEDADRAPTPADSQPSTYNPTAAVARIQALRAEGLSLLQIATQLNAEGVPTRRGRPWRDGTIGWFLHHYGP